MVATMRPGDRVRLKGRTGYGKNRVREHGKWWLVFDVRNEIQVKPPGSGPWALVRPKDKPWRDIRWIHAKRDEDFDVY